MSCLLCCLNGSEAAPTVHHHTFEAPKQKGVAESRTESSRLLYEDLVASVVLRVEHEHPRSKHEKHIHRSVKSRI